MPNTSQTLRTNAGFFHSLGKVLTESANSPGNEKYKSAHNVRSNEVWMDSIPFAIDSASASQYADNVIVRQVGSSSTIPDLQNTFSEPVYCYPLTQTNYQTWFLDIGTPTPQPDGFEPSSGWVKPLINPSDVQRADGFPSLGYGFNMYRPNGTTVISYNNAFFEVDYFGGLIRWEIGKTPADAAGSNGMGFQFDSVTFGALGTASKQAYIQSSSTGGPRALAFQYVGQLLSNYTIGSGTGFTAGPGLTLSAGATLSVSVDETTITINNLGQLQAIGGGGTPYYQYGTPTSCLYEYSPTGITISYTPTDYSRVQVFINGQLQRIGDGTYSSVDCYFSPDSLIIRTFSSITSGDELYWNAATSGFSLAAIDKVDIIYEY
jgi:hypothetical protein